MLIHLNVTCRIGTFDAPVYFIFESEDIENVLADMASTDTSDVRAISHAC